MSALRKEMRKSGLIERYTPQEVLKEMETLTKIKYSGKYGHILTEGTKSQREILKDLYSSEQGLTFSGNKGVCLAPSIDTKKIC